MGLIGGLYSLLGYINHSKGNLDKAEKLYNKAMDKDSLKANHQMSYGVLLLKKGDFERAKKVFEGLLIFSSDKPMIKNSAKINQSIVYWKLGDLDTALEMIQEVHNKLKNTRTYALLGYLLIEAGDLDKALAFNLEAYDYDDTDAELIDNLAQTYYRLGDKENALKYFKLAEEENPDQISTLYHLGCLYQEKGDLEGAREMFNRALERDISAISSISRSQIEERLASLA
jgi:tetratricopeptide (TPR) repeat protein